MTIDPSRSRQIAEHKHDGPLTACACDAKGRFVFAGGRARGVVCLDIAASKIIAIEGHGSWISSIVRAGEDLVLTADYVGHVIAWDCTGSTPKARWDISAHANVIYSLAASADGKWFATGDRDGIIRIWQGSNGQRAHEIAGLAHPVYGLAFHPDGQRLVSADRQPQKPRLKIWEFATGKEQRSIDVPQLSAYRRVEDIEWGGIRAIAISPDGKTLVAVGSNGYSGPAAALLFDVSTGELKRTLLSTLKGFYYSAQFHLQGFLLTSGGDVGKGEVRAWDPNRDESLATLATPGPCTSIGIHFDGRRFFVTQMNGKRSYPDSGSLTLYEWT